MKFSEMTKAQKRVAIAKDTLKWLKAGKIEPTTGTVLSFKDIALTEGKSFQTLFKKLTTPCEVCERGGLLYSYVRRVNKFLSTGDVIGGTVGSPRMFVSIDKAAQCKLEEIFSKKQLALIERAYEGDYNYKILSGEELASCDEYFYQFVAPEERFVAILENIIDNNGTFKP